MIFVGVILSVFVCYHIDSIAFDTFYITKTANDVGELFIEHILKNPYKKIVFITTACDFSQRMFRRLSSFLDIQGVGLELTGRVCGNFKTFVLAEKGKKNSKTDISSEHKEFIFKILDKRKELFKDSSI